MNEQTAYTITGKLALIVWVLAFIGVVAVAKIIFKQTLKMFKYIINSLNKQTLTLQKPQRKKAENRYTKELNEYYQSTYFLTTKNRYEDVQYDKGLLGEYNIFRMLRTFENYGARFLFNCYLPREHNETTEIDIILLTHNGIFVIESKNYDGWIFGSEDQDLWTQTLPAGNKIHKTHFYNPIRQNSTHIKYLKKIIGDNLPIYPIIIFSDNCTLKDIKVTNPETKVIYLGHAIRTVSDLSTKTPNSISQENLVSIYDKLFPYTQVSESIKQQHIRNINKKIKM